GGRGCSGSLGPAGRPGDDQPRDPRLQLRLLPYRRAFAVSQLRHSGRAPARYSRPGDRGAGAERRRHSHVADAAHVGRGGGVLAGDPHRLADDRHAGAGSAGRNGARLGHRGWGIPRRPKDRSEEHTSELQSRSDLVCRLLLEKKKKQKKNNKTSKQKNTNKKNTTITIICPKTSSINYNNTRDIPFTKQSICVHSHRYVRTSRS